VKYLKIILSGALLALVLAAFLFVPTLIKVRNISCHSQFGPCSRELEDKIASYQGKNLKSAKARITDYLKSQPQVKDFSFQFKLSDKLIVNLIEAKAHFAIGNKEMGTFSLVDKEGKVVEIQNSTNLPILLVSDKPPNLGEKVGPDKLFALEIIYSLFSVYQVKEGKIEGDTLKIIVPDGIEATFPLQGDKDKLLGSLVLILMKLKSEPKDSKIDYTHISKIDLRFENPVLK